jgi:hypothetical protein
MRLFMLYLMTLLVANTVEHGMVGLVMIMKLKGCERNRS